MTGYPSGPEVVQATDGNGNNIGGPVTLHTLSGGTLSNSDGFTVLANGNWLINDGDATNSYNQYDPTTGMEIPGPHVVASNGSGACAELDRRRQRRVPRRQLPILRLQFRFHRTGLHVWRLHRLNAYGYHGRRGHFAGSGGADHSADRTGTCVAGHSGHSVGRLCRGAATEAEADRLSLDNSILRKSAARRVCRRVWWAKLSRLCARARPL